MKILLWAILLINQATSHRVTESVEDIEPPSNITTLYPIPTANDTTKNLHTDATWKIETTFAESKIKLEENATESKESIVEEKVNKSEEFKPSPHLGDFVEGLEVIPTRETFGPFSPVIKKPPTGFINSPKHGFKATAKFPTDIFKNYNGFPYKFENPILARAKDNWKPTSGMDSKPTAEVPVRVPAGGLYQLPDAFKEKPSLNGDDEEFGLEFHGDVKEHALKKRANPWKKLMHLITALIPVGLIVSALTPNVITIQNTGAGFDNQIPQHIFRRSDAAATATAPAAPISERCRRRLLCELQSDINYLSPTRRGPCHRLRCEDPAALASTLTWLLAHRPPEDQLTLL